MRTTSLGFKLLSLTVGTILAFILMFGGLVYINFRDVFRKQLVDKGVQLADFLNKHSSISYGIMAEEKFLLSEAINLFMRDNDVVFASALNREGEILAYKTKNDAIVEDLRWYISGLVSQNSVSDRRIIEKKTAEGEEIILFFYPVMSDKEELVGSPDRSVMGYTVLVLTLQNFYRDFFRRIFNIGLTIGVAAIVVLGMISYLIRNNIKPLVELKEKAEKISKERELRERVEVETGDEIQEIAESFSRMIDILKGEIHNIKVVSKRLSDMSQDIFRTMERVNQSTAEQSSKITEIELLVDSIYGSGSDTAIRVDSIVETVEFISQRINEIEGILSHMKNISQLVYQKTDEILAGVLDTKRSVEEIGQIDGLINCSSDFSKTLEVFKRTLSDTLDEARDVHSLFDVVSEGVQQASSESDNIGYLITNTRRKKEELSVMISSARKEVEEIMDLVFELLDFTDDTNMLAINASIIASHEKGQKGREFGVVAEEIKKLSQDTENKIKKIKDKLRVINQRLISASRIADVGMEEDITDISNMRESISGGVTKARNIIEDIRSRLETLSSSFEKVTQSLNQAESGISGLHEQLRKVCRSLDVSKKVTDRIEPLIKELNDILVKIFGEFQNVSDKLSKVEPAMLKLADELMAIKEESRAQFSGIENIKDKAKELGNIIYEINKIIIFSLSKVKLISELGTKLEEITKQYKT